MKLPVVGAKVQIPCESQYYRTYEGQGDKQNDTESIGDFDVCLQKDQREWSQIGKLHYKG